MYLILGRWDGLCGFVVGGLGGLVGYICIFGCFCWKGLGVNIVLVMEGREGWVGVGFEGFDLSVGWCGVCFGFCWGVGRECVGGGVGERLVFRNWSWDGWWNEVVKIEWEVLVWGGFRGVRCLELWSR